MKNEEDSAAPKIESKFDHFYEFFNEKNRLYIISAIYGDKLKPLKKLPRESGRRRTHQAGSWQVKRLAGRLAGSTGREGREP